MVVLLAIVGIWLGICLVCLGKRWLSTDNTGRFPEKYLWSTLILALVFLVQFTYFHLCTGELGVHNPEWIRTVASCLQAYMGVAAFFAWLGAFGWNFISLSVALTCHPRFWAAPLSYLFGMVFCLSFQLIETEYLSGWNWINGQLGVVLIDFQWAVVIYTCSRALYLHRKEQREAYQWLMAEQNLAACAELSDCDQHLVITQENP